MLPRVGSASLLEAPPPASAGEPLLPAFTMAIRSVPSSVEVVRRVTRAWVRCHCRPLENRVDALLVVVSELCTNAILYGRHDSFDVRGWMPARDELRLEIHDGTPTSIPEPLHVGPEAESGRGLLLVDILVTELGGAWGFTEDGTCAWCSLAFAGTAQ